MYQNPDDIDIREEIIELKNENERLREKYESLEVRIETQLESKPTQTTRRRALGLLGGSALLGATGTANAQSTDHDHSGDYLGETAPVNQFDVAATTAGSITAEQLQNIHMLSSFDTVQDAINYSQANRVPVYVDGTYTTNEDHVTITEHFSLIGNGTDSEIIVKDSPGTGAFFQVDLTREPHRMHMEGITFERRGGSPRQFITRIDTTDGWIHNTSVIRDLIINDFGGTYTFELRNGYAVAIENITINQANTQSNGEFHFDNFNACNLSDLASYSGKADDGETPNVYIEASMATQIDAMQIEHMDTDACIQISNNSIVTINNLHIEDNFGTYRCGVQLGDGGITAGNTSGNVSARNNLIMVGGLLHGSDNDHDNVRLLNGNHVVLQNVITGHVGAGTHAPVRYGGSNNDTHSDLTIDPPRLVITGGIRHDVVNDSGLDHPPIHIMRGNVFTSTTEASDDSLEYELFFLDTGDSHALVRNIGNDSYRVWEHDRTL